MTRLWIRIWKRSQVLEPSPQGVLRVVILRILVGIRTGPLTLSFCFLVPWISSAQTWEKKMWNYWCDFFQLRRIFFTIEIAGNLFSLLIHYFVYLFNLLSIEKRNSDKKIRISKHLRLCLQSQNLSRQYSKFRWQWKRNLSYEILFLIIY